MNPDYNCSFSIQLQYMPTNINSPIPLSALQHKSNVFTALVWWDFKTIIPIESLVMKSQPLRDGVRDPVDELSHGEGSNKYKGVCNTKQNFRPKPAEQLLKQHLNLKAALLTLIWEYNTKINHREHSFLPSTPSAPYMLLAIHVGEMPASAVHSHFMLPPYSFPSLLVLSLLLTVFSHFLCLILWTSHLRYLLSPDNFLGGRGCSVLWVQVDLTWLKIKNSVCFTLFNPAHLRLIWPCLSFWITFYFIVDQ